MGHGVRKDVHKAQDEGDSDSRNRSPNDQVFVRLGGKRAHPEPRNKKVVGQNGYRKNIYELPAEQA